MSIIDSIIDVFGRMLSPFHGDPVFVYILTVLLLIILKCCTYVWENGNAAANANGILIFNILIMFMAFCLACMVGVWLGYNIVFKILMLSMMLGFLGLLAITANSAYTVMKRKMNPPAPPPLVTCNTRAANRV